MFIEYIMIGSGFAFAAAVQPGPLQAFLFTSVTQRGWKKTLPASFSPLLSDGPVALLVLFFLNRLPELMKPLLQCAGGFFLLYISLQTYLQLKRGKETESKKKGGGEPKTIIEAAIVNILNPNPYIGWSLVLGPAFLKAWKESPAYGVTILVSFYFTMVLSLATIIFVFGSSGMLTEEKRRKLSFISVAILILIGIYQIISGAKVFIQ